MLSCILKLKPDNYPLLYIATLYHDIVYDPKRNDNEELSYQRCELDLKSYIDKKDLNLIKKMILKSKHKGKLNSNGFSSKEYYDLKIFIDADLSILGESKKEYKIYSSNIRKEYSHVSNEDYKIGRTKFLKSMLKRSRIFNVLSDYKEFRARKNIENEIEELNDNSK